MDDMLPLALFDVLQTGFMCLGVFVLVAAAVPFILPVFVLLLVIFYYFRWGSQSRGSVGMLVGVPDEGCLLILALRVTGRAGLMTQVQGSVLGLHVWED